MKYPSIVIKAGPTAISILKKEGLHPSHIKTIAAAAGGPKWFVIYHLMRYVAKEILPGTEGSINLIGSSVGAWQMACLATAQPEAALTRLRDNYAEEEYQFPVTSDDVSRGCNITLKKTFSTEDANYILSNKNVNLCITAAKGRGLLNNKSRWRQYSGLMPAFLTNALSRKTLDWYFRRHLFSSQYVAPFDLNRSVLQTELYRLHIDNLYPTLMATAAIPLLMNGVDYISDLHGQVFWDGGLTDYHMALPYKDDGLVLLPHFLPEIIPGWLDKKLKYRRGRGDDLSNVVLIHPSDEYVSSLPKGKITSREDFVEYGSRQKERAEYWKAVSEKGKTLAEELDLMIETGDLAKEVQPL